MPKHDAHADRAAKILAHLADARAHTAGYPLAASKLRDALGEAVSDADLFKALAHPSLAGKVVVAGKKDVAAPVALAEDAAALAASDALLEYAVSKAVAPAKPLADPAKLSGKVDPSLADAFAASVADRIAAKRLPPTVGHREVKGKVVLYLVAVPPPPPPLPKRSLAELLAEAIVTAYRQRVESIVPLADLVPAGAAAGAVKRALAEPLFSETLRATPVTKSLTLVGPADADAAASDEALVYVVSRLSTAEVPYVPAAKVIGGVEKAVKDAFADALAARLTGGRLPAGLAAYTEKGKHLVGLAKFPKPEAPTTSLAKRLLAKLELDRAAGHLSPPPTLAELLRRSGHPAFDKTARAALSHEAVAGKIVVAVPASADSPVGLAEEAASLADSPALFAALLGVALDDDNEAVAAADLGKALAPELREPVAAKIASGQLPPGVGVLRIKKKPFLYRTPAAANVFAPPVKVAPAERLDFASAFAEAFERIDRRTGSHNQVSLIHLRRELPIGREEFDRELAELRRSGTFFLESAEGRHAIPDDERAAGIQERDRLYLYVGRRDE